MKFKKFRFVKNDTESIFTLNPHHVINRQSIEDQGWSTSILFDSFRSALYPWANSFDAFARGNKEPGRELPTGVSEVTLLGLSDENDGQNLNWLRARNSKSGKTTDREFRSTAQILKRLQVNVRTEGASETAILPVILAITDNPASSSLASKSIDSFSLHRWSRTFGYCGCLESPAHWKLFEGWFIWVTTAWWEAKLNISEGRDFFHQLTVFTKLRNLIFDAWNRILIGYPEHIVEAKVDDYNKWSLMARVEGSEWIKPIDLEPAIFEKLKIVSLIAYQCQKLNSPLNEHALSQSPGIAVIQSKLIFEDKYGFEILKSIFPKIQFVLLP